MTILTGWDVGSSTTIVPDRCPHGVQIGGTVSCLDCEDAALLSADMERPASDFRPLDTSGLLRRYALWSLTPDFRWIATATAIALFIVAVLWSPGAVLMVLVGMAVLRMASIAKEGEAYDRYWNRKP